MVSVKRPLKPQSMKPSVQTLHTEAVAVGVAVVQVITLALMGMENKWPNEFILKYSEAKAVVSLYATYIFGNGVFTPEQKSLVPWH